MSGIHFTLSGNYIMTYYIIFVAALLFCVYLIGLSIYTIFDPKASSEFSLRQLEKRKAYHQRIIDNVNTGKGTTYRIVAAVTVFGLLAIIKAIWFLLVLHDTFGF